MENVLVNPVFDLMYLSVECMKPSKDLTGYRSPSCCPYIPSSNLWGSHEQSPQSSILNIHRLAFCPTASHGGLSPHPHNYCVHLYLPSLYPPQDLCIHGPVDEPQFCQMFSWFPLLALFTHLPIRELFLDT